MIEWTLLTKKLVGCLQNTLLFTNNCVRPSTWNYNLIDVEEQKNKQRKSWLSRNEDKESKDNAEDKKMQLCKVFKGITFMHHNFGSWSAPLNAQL